MNVDTAATRLPGGRLCSGSPFGPGGTDWFPRTLANRGACCPVFASFLSQTHRSALSKSDRNSPGREPPERPPQGRGGQGAEGRRSMCKGPAAGGPRLGASALSGSPPHPHPLTRQPESDHRPPLSQSSHRGTCPRCPRTALLPETLLSPLSPDPFPRLQTAEKGG